MDTEPAAIAALDQLEGLCTEHAKIVGCYYRELVSSGIGTDTASLLASYLARDLRRMVFHK